MSLLDDYANVAGHDAVAQLRQLAARLSGASVVHVNSTRVGGGVAEILAKLVPLMQELGLDAHWEVIEGTPEFYDCTKRIHNALQGMRAPIKDNLLRTYERTNAEYAETRRDILEHADFVFIHDPQPAPLLSHCQSRRGKWIWRCHIDASHPYRTVWRYLRNFIKNYDASIFSLGEFAQSLPHPQYLIPPSIDPLSDKNVDLSDDELRAVHERFQLDPERPILVQISRFDRFKDPLGVIQAYQLARTFAPGLQLVLAGGTASDDPEGGVVLEEVQGAAGKDENVHVLPLPSDAHRTVNGLQRAADIVLQKSIREGFGLTVTEAHWKGKPVIGGDVGGIRLQITNFHTGFLVSSAEGAALRIRYLLHQPRKIQEMGGKGRKLVRENFLITRHLREYLTLMMSVRHGDGDRIELG